VRLLMQIQAGDLCRLFWILLRVEIYCWALGYPDVYVEGSSY